MFQPTDVRSETANNSHNRQCLFMGVPHANGSRYGFLLFVLRFAIFFIKSLDISRYL